jgi:hypothetical protein
MPHLVIVVGCMEMFGEAEHFHTPNAEGVRGDEVPSHSPHFFDYAEKTTYPTPPGAPH